MHILWLFMVINVYALFFAYFIKDALQMFLDHNYPTSLELTLMPDRQRAHGSFAIRADYSIVINIAPPTTMVIF